jgi:hypothetical protein
MANAPRRLEWATAEIAAKLAGEIGGPGQESALGALPEHRIDLSY